MKKIVLINGSGGCGKSTFIKFCKVFSEQVIELSTVDYVKEVAKNLGWDGIKTEKSRKFLHNLKNTLEEWDDSPNVTVMQAIEKDTGHCIFFVNVREIEGIRRLYKIFKQMEDTKCYTVLVKNPNVMQITSNEADANVDHYKYDYVIENDGTLGNLLDKAGAFLDEIMWWLIIDGIDKKLRKKMDSEKYFSPLTCLIDYYTKSLYKDKDGSTHLSIECHSLLLHIAGIRNKNKL